MFLQTQIEIF